MLNWSGKIRFHVEHVLADNEVVLFWHLIFVRQHHSDLTLHISRHFEFITVWQTKLSIHKKKTETVIFSHHVYTLEMLWNQSDTTSMTLQVTNKGFKGIASNMLVLLRTGRREKRGGTLMTSSLSQDISRADPFKQPGESESTGASGWLQLPTRTRYYIH